MPAGKRVTELVGGDHLLREGREVSDTLSHAEINHKSAILPDIVMIVAIIPGVVNEPVLRTLIHMHVMHTIAIMRVKAAEDIDDRLVFEGFL
jgi:hypothetical protein